MDGTSGGELALGWDRLLSERISIKLELLQHPAHWGSRGGGRGAGVLLQEATASWFPDDSSRHVELHCPFTLGEIDSQHQGALTKAPVSLFTILLPVPFPALGVR